MRLQQDGAGHDSPEVHEACFNKDVSRLSSCTQLVTKVRVGPGQTARCYEPQICRRLGRSRPSPAVLKACFRRLQLLWILMPAAWPRTFLPWTRRSGAPAGQQAAHEQGYLSGWSLWRVATYQSGSVLIGPCGGGKHWRRHMAGILAMHGAHLGVVGMLLEGGWVPRHLIDGRHDLRVVVPCMINNQPMMMTVTACPLRVSITTGVTVPPACHTQQPKPPVVDSMYHQQHTVLDGWSRCALCALPKQAVLPCLQPCSWTSTPRVFLVPTCPAAPLLWHASPTARCL